ncbi:asparagine amidase a, partial [Diplocarpon rosae]
MVRSLGLGEGELQSLGVQYGERVKDGPLAQDTERWGEKWFEDNGEETDNTIFLKGTAIIGICLALLGWVSYFSPHQIQWNAQSVEEVELDYHARQVPDIQPRQDPSLLPLSSASLSPVPGVLTTPCSLSTSTSTATTMSTSTRALKNTSTSMEAPTPVSVLQVFQLDPPIMGPGRVLLDDGLGNTRADVESTTGSNGTLCQVTLMQFEFQDSFGKPFVGNFTPPACMGDSNTVMMNMTVHSKGTQFDRLAIMYLGDTEVFRTSTAEPRQAGISWTYVKDMSHLMAMWKSPQKIIFDLPNQTTVNLTGTYATTMTATFFNAQQAVNAANVILPLSARRGVDASQPSAFTLSSANASIDVPTESIPRNSNRAIVTIAATGQGDEEFWWQNTLSSAVATYNSSAGLLFGNSTFREVQLMIDGQMAGVVWPYPVIFSGGIVPAFWSPMVGTQAFDLTEGEVDVSPWLGILCDGQAHSFDMRVVGLSDDAGETAVLSQGVGSNWVVSGKLFIWTDSSNSSATSGNAPTIQAPPPAISVSQSVTQSAAGGNDTLVYSTSVRRTLTITSNIKTAEYPNGRNMVWTQILDQSTNNSFTHQGEVQYNAHTTTGTDSFLRGVEAPYTKTYQYPLTVNSTGSTLPNGTTTFSAHLSRSRIVEIDGQGVAPSGLQPFAALPDSATLVKTLKGTTMAETQSGNATLVLARGSGGIAGTTFGALRSETRLGGRSEQGVIGMQPDEELWFRQVSVVNGTVREDVERVNKKGVLAGFDVVI